MHPLKHDPVQLIGKRLLVRCRYAGLLFVKPNPLSQLKWETISWFCMFLHILKAEASTAFDSWQFFFKDDIVNSLKDRYSVFIWSGSMLYPIIEDPNSLKLRISHLKAACDLCIHSLPHVYLWKWVLENGPQPHPKCWRSGYQLGCHSSVTQESHVF